MPGPNPTSFSEYLRLYNASWLKLQRTSPTLNSYEDRALYTTWQVTFDRIQKQNAASAQLLKLWAYFDKQDLWFGLLQHARSAGDEWIQKLTEDELGFNERHLDGFKCFLVFQVTDVQHLHRWLCYQLYNLTMKYNQALATQEAPETVLQPERTSSRLAIRGRLRRILQQFSPDTADLTFLFDFKRILDPILRSFRERILHYQPGRMQSAEIDVTKSVEGGKNDKLIEAKMSHVVELKPEDWEKIFDTNAMLRAWVATITADDEVLVKRARYAAIMFDENCKAPYRDVDDDCRIHVQETTNAISSKLSDRGFTDKGIQASLAAGSHGMTLGVGGDIAARKETTSRTNTQTVTKSLHCSYYFPRVPVYITTDKFKVTEKCLQELEKLKKKMIPRMQGIDGETSLLTNTGGVIPKTVTLGGRLYGSEPHISAQEDTIETKKKELKASLSSTFTAPFLGASIGAHRQKGGELSIGVTSSVATRDVSIEAHGGNGLVSWSPSLWATSLSDYLHWRVIQQEDVVSSIQFLYELVSKATHDDFAGQQDLDKNYFDSLESCAAVINELKRLLDIPANVQTPADELELKITYGNTWRWLEPRQRTKLENEWAPEFFLDMDPPDKCSTVVLYIKNYGFPQDVTFKSPGRIRCPLQCRGTFPISFIVHLKTGWAFVEGGGKTKELKKKTFEWTLQFGTDAPLRPQTKGKYNIRRVINNK
ncbi:hypothetical protein IQ07DRAFT_686163 [Pyrenochaeta sp. DS3sAY3a]|nr:hypothetical protein IQ07DRAFT_686163 [Pyrenochaeta sp. DS3sAY3a]